MMKFKELSMLDKSSDKKLRKRFFWVITDLKYILKERPIQFFIENQGAEELISHFRKM